MNRREALRRLGLNGALLSAGAASLSCERGTEAPRTAVPVGPLGPLGLELYTVRAAIEWDLPAALAEVAAIGFREVEFAGYFGYSPRQIGNALFQSGLTAPSALVSVDELIEGWLATVQAAAEIGHRWLVIAWLPDEMRSSLDAWRLTAELFNRAADEATVYGGIRLAYHNRDFEFLPIEDRLPIEVLLEETDPSTFDLALDVPWMVSAGADPADFLRQWPGRVPLIHAGDITSEGRLVEVGAGVVDWTAILSQRFSAGILHTFVDHEEADDPFAMARASFEYLNALNV